MRLEGHAAPASEMTEQPHITEQPETPASPSRLRSRAEQIADELEAENRRPEPTVRRLPAYEPPAKHQIPGR
jgi:hypothetical protein